MKIRVKLLLLVMLLVIASCAASRGVFHTVKKGETFWRICQTYDVELQEVAEINNIRNPSKIRLGQKVFIPGASHVKRVPPAGNAIYAKKGKKVRRKVVIEKGRFIWPAKGKVISSFGVHGQTRNDGIDIKAPNGSGIKASDAGVVAHVHKDMRVFGNFVILKHSGDFYTLYAHAQSLLVKEGQRVKKGEVIAKVGSSGDATQSMLHFEIRAGAKVRNPLFLLP